MVGGASVEVMPSPENKIEEKESQRWVELRAARRGHL